MNKTFLTIAALIVVASIGTSLVVTSRSSNNQTATTILADKDGSLDSGDGCYTQYYVFENGTTCNYYVETICPDTVEGPIGLYLYQSIPTQKDYDKGPLLAPHCLPPLTPVDPSDQAPSGGGSGHVSFDFDPGYPKKLSDKEADSFIKEQFGMDTDTYTKLVLKLIAPTAAQLQQFAK